jgi:hypothetical protein
MNVDVFHRGIKRGIEENEDEHGFKKLIQVHI